jgi:hypothetical protein
MAEKYRLEVRDSYISTVAIYEGDEELFAIDLREWSSADKSAAESAKRPGNVAFLARVRALVEAANRGAKEA